MDVTADIVYCRLHGSEKLYASGYTPDAIDVWARRMIAWSRGEELRMDEGAPEPGPKRSSRDVFVYFDNDLKVARRSMPKLSKRIAKITGPSAKSEP